MFKNTKVSDRFVSILQKYRRIYGYYQSIVSNVTSRITYDFNRQTVRRRFGFHNHACMYIILYNNAVVRVILRNVCMLHTSRYTHILSSHMWFKSWRSTRNVNCICMHDKYCMDIDCPLNACFYSLLFVKDLKMESSFIFCWARVDRGVLSCQRHDAKMRPSALAKGPRHDSGFRLA